MFHRSALVLALFAVAGCQDEALSPLDGGGGAGGTGDGAGPGVGPTGGGGVGGNAPMADRGDPASFPTDCHTDCQAVTVSNGNGWMQMESTEYFVIEVDPGAYVASGMMTHTGYQQTNTTFCLGTISFVAPAGQAVYVGNMHVPRLGATIMPRPPNMQAAAAKLAEYPGVQQTVTAAEMQNVTYPPSGMCDRARR